MRNFRRSGGFFAFFLGLALAGALIQADGQDTPGKRDQIQVPPPPLSEDIFPCTSCHADMEVNRERRELEEFHDNINFEHDEENRWCMDCHDADNRDMLHLASGELISYEESYRLCGQCHGPKLRDWKAGIHGRRTGSWNGPKEYLLCAHCHNPHSPKFPLLKPEPAPEKPDVLLIKKGDGK